MQLVSIRISAIFFKARYNIIKDIVQLLTPTLVSYSFYITMAMRECSASLAVQLIRRISEAKCKLNLTFKEVKHASKHQHLLFMSTSI